MANFDDLSQGYAWDEDDLPPGEPPIEPPPAAPPDPRNPGGEAAMFYCADCSRMFSKKNNYYKHLLSPRCLSNRLGDPASTSRGFYCDPCEKDFYSKQSLERHNRTFHSGPTIAFPCSLCPKFFTDKAELDQHRKDKHVRHHDFQLSESAHKKAYQKLRAFVPDEINTSVTGALVWGFDQLVSLLTTFFVAFPFFKVRIYLFVEMMQLDQRGRVERVETFPFTSYGLTLARGMEYEEELKKLLGDIEENVSEFLFQGSGWIVNQTPYYEIEVAQCHPLGGKSKNAPELRAALGDPVCRTHAEAWKKDRGVHLKNLPDDGDGFCFFYAVANGILGVNATESEVNRLVREQMVIPFTISHLRLRGVLFGQVGKFEEANKALDVSINILYQNENGTVNPIRRGGNPSAKNQVNLLLCYTETTDDGGGETCYVGHYAYIKNIAKLLASRKEYNSVNHTAQLFFCVNCLNQQWKLGAHLNHLSWCLTNDAGRVVMPRKGSQIFFDKEKEMGKTQKQAFTIVYDFEALHVPVSKSCSCPDEVIAWTRELKESKLRFKNLADEDQLDIVLEQAMMEGEALEEYQSKMSERMDGWSRGDPSKVKRRRTTPVNPIFETRRKVCPHVTKIIAEQPPFCYSLVMFDRFGEVVVQTAYANHDAADHLVRTIMDLADTYLPKLSPGIPMKRLSPEERRKLKNVDACYLCKLPLAQSDIVLDHDHLSGMYLGPAHSKCNLARRERHSITCFAHNFSGYDSHFVVGALQKLKSSGRIFNLVAIPATMQKIKILIANNRVRFEDTSAFFEGSLEKLVGILAASNSAFPILSSMASSPEELEMLKRKGVYPYSFATSIQVLRETKAIPPREAFYNDLAMEECSLEDYEWAKKVFKETGCRNMLDYTTLYVNTDTLLLADVVFHFRDTIFKVFELDMCAFFSIPHLAMTAMLKHTGVRIDMMDNQEMADMVRKNIRGGHSFVNIRYVEVAPGVRRCLLFLDMNNLYGMAMSLGMPFLDYEMVLAEACRQILLDHLGSFSEDDTFGYAFEVDLHYPPHLHEEHNSFPLLPESCEITGLKLSPYSMDCNREIGHKADPTTYKARKLTSTFGNRRKYLVHALALQYYVGLGIKILKVHRGVKFRQSKFLKPFIEMCTENRNKAPTKAESECWKLIVNSVYGKFIESTANRMDAKFNSDAEQFKRRVTSPLYKGSVSCGSDGGTISFMRKKADFVKQGWLVGFTILEMSKLLMARMFYDRIRPALGRDNVDVVLSDTDSFLLDIRGYTEDEAMLKLKDVMDFSNLPQTHPLYDDSRKRKPGLLKNETPDCSIRAVAAVRSKSYFCLTHAGPCHAACECKVTAKGVKQSARRKMSIEDYKSCIFEKRKVTVRQTSLQSRNHVNRLVQMEKVAFSSLDDKRYQTCSVHSVPYDSVLIEYQRQAKECFYCAKAKGGAAGGRARGWLRMRTPRDDEDHAIRMECQSNPYGGGGGGGLETMAEEEEAASPSTSSSSSDDSSVVYHEVEFFDSDEMSSEGDRALKRLEITPLDSGGDTPPRDSSSASSASSASSDVDPISPPPV